MKTNTSATFYSKLLRFRETKGKFELKKHFSEMISNCNFSVDLFIFRVENMMYTLAKGMYFHQKPRGKESNRDRSLASLVKPPAIMALGWSLAGKRNFLSDSNELCDKLELLLQKMKEEKLRT